MPATSLSEKCKVVLHLHITTTMPEAGGATKVVWSHVGHSTPSVVSSSGANMYGVNKCNTIKSKNNLTKRREV